MCVLILLCFFCIVFPVDWFIRPLFIRYPVRGRRRENFRDSLKTPALASEATGLSPTKSVPNGIGVMRAEGLRSYRYVRKKRESRAEAGANVALVESANVPLAGSSRGRVVSAASESKRERVSGSFTRCRPHCGSYAKRGRMNRPL